MFNEKKTLIVVYKDEMLVNQFKKLVESCDDPSFESIIGSRDGSINVVSWTEKVWMDNKKAGNINSKILFLGDIKGTDKLIPVIDVKFDDFGVKYGWAGNQAVLYCDIKALNSRDDYLVFLEKLSELPVPEMIKNANKSKSPQILEDVEEICFDDDADVSIRIVDQVSTNKRGTLHRVKDAIVKGANVASSAFEKAGNDVVHIAEDLFRNKASVKKQMLFYGVVNLYATDLESFMCS